MCRPTLNVLCVHRESFQRESRRIACATGWMAVVTHNDLLMLSSKLLCQRGNLKNACVATLPTNRNTVDRADVFTPCFQSCMRPTAAAVLMLQAGAADNPESEVVFNALTRALLREGTVPPGAVLDVGANDGSWTRMYAKTAPSRKVHAVEPLYANVQHIQRTHVSASPNIVVTHGGLGAFNHYRSGAQGPRAVGDQIRMEQTSVQRVDSGVDAGSSSSNIFQVRTLDEMFANETLGFAHIDVEGSELSVLRGATRVIARDQPIFTVEVHVHLNLTYSRSLLMFVDQLGYSAFSIAEVCGWRMDCRNILCLPRSRALTYERSEALELAVASRRLFAVVDIAKHGYSCCAPGGACPRCIEQDVMHWYQSQVVKWKPTPNPPGRAPPRHVTYKLPPSDVMLMAMPMFKGAPAWVASWAEATWSTARSPSQASPHASLHGSPHASRGLVPPGARSGADPQPFSGYVQVRNAWCRRAEHRLGKNSLADCMATCREVQCACIQYRASPREENCRWMTDHEALGMKGDPVNALTSPSKAGFDAYVRTRPPARRPAASTAGGTVAT